MNKKRIGKSFLITITKEGKIIMRGDEKDIKKFIKIMKNKRFKIKKLEIYPCL